MRRDYIEYSSFVILILMKYSGLFLILSVLLVVGALTPFSVSAHHIEDSEGNKCQVSYDEGKTWQEGEWSSEDPNRVCLTTHTSSKASEPVAPTLSKKESSEIKKLNNRITELNSKLQNKKSFKSLRTYTLKRQLEIRKEKMLELVKEDTDAFFELMLSEETRKVLPEGLQKLAEEKVEITGDLMHRDSLEAMKENRIEHILKTDKEYLTVYASSENQKIEGQNITVVGYRLGETLIGPYVLRRGMTVARFDPTTAGPIFANPNAPALVTERHMAVFLVDFDNSPNQPFTPSQAHDLIFNGQFEKFIEEQSYGRVKFTGEVFNWITLPNDGSVEDRFCTADIQTTPMLQSFIVNQGINLENYSDIVYIMNCDDQGVGGYASVQPITVAVGTTSFTGTQATLQGEGNNFLNTSTWLGAYPSYSWTNLDFLLSHEIGHNFGLWHSNALDCFTAAVSLAYEGECFHREYGNPYDHMGAGDNFSAHFNAFQKEKAGWILPRETVTIKNSGRYELDVLETASSRSKIAKILVPVNYVTRNPSAVPLYPLYYLEYRDGIGFDENLNYPMLSNNKEGLFINTPCGITCTVPIDDNTSPELVDMTPTSDYSYQDLKDATLRMGNIFSDPRRGVRIKNVFPFIGTNGEKKISFEVELQPVSCVREAPTINLFSPIDDDKDLPGLEVYRDEFFDLYVLVKNKDYLPCGASTFDLELQTPTVSWINDAGETKSIDAENGMDFYSLGNQGSIALFVPPTTPVGLYDIDIKVVNRDSGLSTRKTFTLNVMDRPL